MQLLLALAFTGTAGCSTGGRAGWEIRSWSTRQVERWQRELVAYVGALVSARTAAQSALEQLPRMSSSLARELQRLAPTIRTGPLTFNALAFGSDVIHLVDGSPRSVLRYVAGRLIEATGSARVLRCPAPAAGAPGRCGRFFVLSSGRGRPAEHCSRKCQQRAWVSARRHDVRELLAEAAAQCYPKLKIAGRIVEGRASWQTKAKIWTEDERRSAGRALRELTPKLTPARGRTARDTPHQT